MNTTPSLFDPDPPAQRHSDTSVAAADAIAPIAGRLRAAVYAHIAECGAAGCTDEEAIAALGMAANTYRPRRRELDQAGLVRDSGKTRLTRSNRKAVVWVSTAVNTEAA